MLTHECPDCRQVVVWPEFVPALKNLSPTTAHLLRTTGALVPWVSQCPNCKATHAKHDILLGISGGIPNVSHVQKDPDSEETTEKERGKETQPLCLPGQDTQEKEA